MKILFIANPVAGKGKVLKIVPKIINVMSHIDNVEYNVIYSERAGHATEIAAAGVKDGYDIIFAVGGDGTVNEVVNGLVNSSSALGIIPGGSGNDFARSLNISGDIEEIIKGSICGDRKDVDIGLVNGRYFVNISSVGFDADVTLSAKKARRFFLSGSVAYIAGLIITIFFRKPSKVRIKLNGMEIRRVILLTVVANGKFYGGGMLPAPDAVVDDGLFDICVIDNLSKIKLFALFPKYIKGTHGELKEVTFYKGQHVEIDSEEPISINIDGEISKGNKLDFKILKKALTVAVPKK